MAHNPDYIPGKNLEFKAWANNFTEKVSTVFYLTFNIPVAKKDELVAANTAYNQVEALIEGGDNRTQNILNRKAARAALEALIREITQQYVRHNPAVNVGQLNMLGLQAYDTERTPIHVPQIAPHVYVEVGTNLWHYVHWGHILTDEKVGGGIPFGATGVQIWRKISDTQPSYEELEFVGNFTKSPQVFTYVSTDRKQTVWYAVRYYNAKGEVGPWSIMIQAIVN
ncbi:MAG: hypothetical protein LBR17_00215 [Bacteroidales bacterium]|jgi:hypothetical protein|nr:hypothetical protein [Bacteroidales bacterium]